VNPFVRLPQSNLESLRTGFATGPLKYEITQAGLICSGAPPKDSEKLLSFIKDRNHSSITVVAILDAILETRRFTKDVSLTQTLVITGPVAAQTENLKTGARFNQVVEHAKKELMLATFALYQGDKILEPVHDAMTRIPGLQVNLILNIARKYGDNTVNEDLLHSARIEFSKNWPWQQRPTIWYFPESLHLSAKDRASMHAKFVIADEERCFITSANFTEAAQKKNIEVGIELSHSHEPKILSQYFKQLCVEGTLIKLF
jgi:phosphatidylserine/phosphatidylglycerophosphate/cardiolipin synthase-like enzyme